MKINFLCTTTGKLDVIDTIITSDTPSFVTSPLTTHPDIGSDHLPFSFTISNIHNIKTQKSTTHALYHRHDWVGAAHLLSSIPMTLETATNIDSYVERLQTTLQNIQKSIPRKTIKTSNQRLNKKTRDKIKLKRKLLYLFKKTKNSALKSQINSLQREIKNDIVEEENKNWDKKIENINNLKTNPAKSWKEIQYVLQTNKKQNRKQLDHVIDSNGTKITDKNDITETFRQKLMNTLQPNEVTDVHHNNQIKNFIDNYKIDSSDLLPFASCEVLNKIKKLKTNKAPGVDQINNKTLLYLSETISPILTKLFNSCLGVGYFPTAFKVAKVTMIPKKGVSKSIDNFRPISLLSTIGKLFESVIASQISNWAENHE